MAVSIHQLSSCGVAQENPKKPRSEDLLWEEFLRDPSQWGDNCNSKPSPRHPPFNHTVTGEPLWIDSWGNPSWVHAELNNRVSTGETYLAAFSTAQIDSFIATLKACTRNKDLVRGSTIHRDLLQKGLLEKCSDALVIMYAKCGELGKAQALLDMHKSKDVITWTSLISGYARERQGQNGLDCFDQMQHEGILPNAVTFICAIKACATIRDAARGKQLHDEIARQGLLQNNVVLGGALVDMYAKCGAVLEARRVIEELPSRNVVSWSALIAGYAQEGQAEQALNCLEQMQCEGIMPNVVTYLCALKACATIGAAHMGKQIHDEVARQGLLHNNIVLGGALVDMYAKCGAISEARRVLEELPSHDVVSWNALITGYAQEGQAEQALNCLEQMQCEGILPDAVTYVCALKACATIRAAHRGKQIHDEIARQGLLQNNIVLGNTLVDMYAKCRAVSEARRVLEGLSSRNVVSWNALISGYAQEGEAEQALNCLEQMQHEGIIPDAVTYVCALKACATIRAAARGKQIHDEIARLGLLQNNIVLGAALVDMYAKCRDISEARRVFEELPSRDVVSWSALIAGYVQEGEAEQALKCFQQMQSEGILPDAVTYVSALKACATIRAADRGKQIHDEVARQELLQNNFVLGGALVDMYAKCGIVSEARRVLEELTSRDVVSWNALIGGYAQEGQAEQALNCFKQMQSEGILPNAVTCTCVLNMCSHRGLVEEGQALFVNMSSKYGVKPSLECYTCMIDLWGRAGHLEKAARLIQEMPSSDYTAVWHALLGACQKWGDVNLGEWAFEQVVELDKSDGSAYVLMANIYGAAGMEEKAKSIEALRIRNKTWKKPGCSWWIDSSKVVHDFSVGDTKHVQNECIDAKLQDLSHKMSQQVYSPGLHWVSQNIITAAKTHLLCRHSEKLALACALINTPQGETVYITKNMPMCGDCHVSTSLISKIEMRKIFITDANLCHHFEDGKCSCNA